MAQVSSISKVETAEPFYLQVARNQISLEIIYIQNDGA